MQSTNKSATNKLVRAFGNIIKRHRLLLDKTMYRISAECGIHKDSWRLIERGLVNDIKISTIWKIAEGLDIPLDELIRELREELGEKFSLTELD